MFLSLVGPILYSHCLSLLLIQFPVSVYSVCHVQKESIVAPELCIVGLRHVVSVKNSKKKVLQPLTNVPWKSVVLFYLLTSFSPLWFHVFLCFHNLPNSNKKRPIYVQNLHICGSIFLIVDKILPGTFQPMSVNCSHFYSPEVSQRIYFVMSKHNSIISN